MEGKKFKLSALIITGILTLAVGLGAGFGISKLVFGLSADEQKVIDEYRVIKNDWLFGNEKEYLEDLVLQGMTSKLDDSYTFYTSDFEQQGLSTSGKGFGFSSHYYDGGLYIVSVVSDSSAYKAGMKAGDVLYSVLINSKTYDFPSLSQSEVDAIFDDSDNSNSTHIFYGKRKGEDVSFSMVKSAYSQDLVTLLQAPTLENDNTLALKIHTFLGSPVTALEGYLSYYKDKTKHLVLDLRDNGGGFLEQANLMAKMFVKKGTLIYQLQYKDGSSYSSYQDKDPAYSFTDYSIILNHNSASASETFTLAMRAGCNCKTYGLTSYGKGISQNFVQFSDNSVLRFTQAYVYGPEREKETMYDEGKDSDSIMCIHGKGIVPDYPFSFDYSFLNKAPIFDSKGISSSGQDHFLNVINTLYPEEYPSSYSSNYLFVDAVRQYGTQMANKYSDDSLANGFAYDGSMVKKLNDKFIKESYDAFLDYDETLLKFALGN